jgi:hypothetical protein
LVHAFENVFEEQKSHWLSCKWWCPFKVLHFNPLGVQNKHFNCLDWFKALEFTYQHDVLLGAKKAQVVVLWLLTFQKTCFVIKSQCWVGLVCRLGHWCCASSTPLIDVNPQWSTSRWLSSVGKTNSSN